MHPWMDPAAHEFWPVSGSNQPGAAQHRADRGATLRCLATNLDWYQIPVLADSLGGRLTYGVSRHYAVSALDPLRTSPSPQSGHDCSLRVDGRLAVAPRRQKGVRRDGFKCIFQLA